MGIQDLLKNKGSELSKYNGTTPPTNPLTLNTSALHSKNGDPGYSLDGDFKGEVKKAYNEYDDGYNNALPQPSGLDLNGKKPKGYVNPDTGATYP
jgi:hypothetical protein|tara:strand:+ start:1167 stop:1451 length:285 start_codon:yes stop_codon:yes gene_type:complete